MKSGMLKGITIADWVKIAGVLGSGIMTFIGFVVWLTHVDSRVTAIAEAQAGQVVTFDVYKKDRSSHDDALLLELRDVNTRLSRIEGMSRAVLTEVKNGR